jgi:16S rRNA (cytosine1402-N4)-methyltransferase
MEPLHRPVMEAEVIMALRPWPGGFYVDGTLGAGGHAAAILEACAPDGRLLGLDRDAEALDAAAERLGNYGPRARLVQAAFADMESQILAHGDQAADGILLDLGVSSMQLDRAPRGFAFRLNGPLDMRMGQEGASAADLIAGLEEKELRRAIATLGEEPFAPRIARALVQAREKEPILTTDALARLVEAALPAAERRKRRLHPATQTFQALRILVNDELGQLETFLAALPRLLKPGGRVAIISYHSLEDRRVKRAFKSLAHPCACPPRLAVCACGKKPLLSLPQAKAIKPSEAEVASNPRARSARLRVAVRTEAPA